MNNNLSRKLRVLVQLGQELEQNILERQSITNDILEVVLTLKRFEKEIAVQPKSKLTPFLLGEANDRIIRFKSGDMGIGLLVEVQQSYVLWAKGNTCPIRKSLYPNFPNEFFSFVCEKMKWNS